MKTNNLDNLGNLAKKYYRLISWASYEEPVFRKEKNKWYYPVIQTMTGAKGFTRNADNGYCHAKVKQLDGNVECIRFSKNTGSHLEVEPVVKIVGKDIVFRTGDIVNNTHENIDWIYYIYIDELTNKASIYKINWKKTTESLQELANSSQNDYFTVSADNYTEYKEDDIPDDYKPHCYYAKMKRPITHYKEGQNCKGIKVFSYKDENEKPGYVESDSQKALYEWLSAKGYNVSSYDSFKAMKSQNKVIWKKDGSRCGFFNDSTTFILIPKHLKVYLCNKYYIYKVDCSLTELIKEKESEFNPFGFITKVNLKDDTQSEKEGLPPDFYVWKAWVDIFGSPF